MAAFADELKKIRRAKGLTIREAAKRCNISHPYFSQLENGQRETPNLLILNQIARGLDVSYIDLKKLAGYIDKDPIKEVTEKFKKEAPKNIDLHEITLFAKYGTDFYYGDAKLTQEQKTFISDIIFALSAALTAENPLTKRDMQDFDSLLDEFLRKRDVN